MTDLSRMALALRSGSPGVSPSGYVATAAHTAELIGRVLLALLFILEAVAKLQGFAAAGRYMAAFGMPPELLPFAILVELGGGLLIALGLYTRPAAAMLGSFCLVAALVFHRKFSDHNQLLHFEKDLALAGAFLVLAVRGAGTYALDTVMRRRAEARDDTPGARAPAVESGQGAEQQPGRSSGA
jgi:putative oxidoreductase